MCVHVGTFFTSSTLRKKENEKKIINNIECETARKSQAATAANYARKIMGKLYGGKKVCFW